jgi:enoyl-CoA hydratase/carnithine racemase
MRASANRRIMRHSSGDAGMGDLVVAEQRGAVRILRLNRPEARNSLSPELIAELGAALDAAVADDGVRAVILTGTGDRAFCAGMDLRAFAEGRTARGAGGGRDPMGAFGKFIRDSIPKPIIGAAQATAVAGGFELLMACDLIVASSAAQFGIPEAKRGLFAAGGGVFLSARIPLALALELGMTGDLINAQRALELGLINRGAHHRERPARRRRDQGADAACGDRNAEGGGRAPGGAATEGLRQRGREGGLARLRRAPRTELEGALTACRSQ